MNPPNSSVNPFTRPKTLNTKKQFSPCCVTRLAVCVSALAIIVAGAQADQIPDGPPPKALPSEPGWGFLANDPPAWKNWFAGQLERNKRGDIDVVFLGDSLTYGWSNNGAQTWKREFESLKAVNYGIGGDTTRQVLWRIDHGLLDGIAPKLIVLMIGTNNLYQDHNSGTDREIADGIKAILERIEEKLPETKILLLSVLPRQTKYFCDRIAAINGMASAYASQRVRVLDVSGDFLDGEGKAKAELFTPDLVHINSAGYEALSKPLKPVIVEMIQ